MLKKSFNNKIKKKNYWLKYWVKEISCLIRLNHNEEIAAILEIGKEKNFQLI
jgi:hypothetical protein